MRTPYTYRTRRSTDRSYHPRVVMPCLLEGHRNNRVGVDHYFARSPLGGHPRVWMVRPCVVLLIVIMTLIVGGIVLIIVLIIHMLMAMCLSMLAGLLPIVVIHMLKVRNWFQKK